ncbi:MAG: HEAT repeat domain-containing protein [Verrucomicrobia bacterium]|nr:HEAT repeat domain-containing protein [Verrucomicrobiota bacterium]
MSLLTSAATSSLAAEPTAAPAKPLTEKLPRIPSKSAAEEAKTFRALDGFRMDLLAAEPLVASPVAMTYDENGRAYVCEMRDYPYTDKAHHKPNQENPTDSPIGRIRLIEDTNGDGKFDKSTVFAEGLSWPTGVACWKGGVFVAATPDIWYLKDTDGDGKADVRIKVFTGFRKLNVQAVMNNLVWALDNHIHGAGGSNGGQIRPGEKPDAKPFVMTRNDFRFDPVTEQMELLSGGARFGGSFDDWGNRFLCNIRNPAQHIVLPQRYLARNPYLAAHSPLNDMAESGDQLPVYAISQPEPWRVLRAKRWAGERDIVMPRSELVGAGVVTASSGVTSYRGAAYPEKYRGNVFVCECAGNLFYRLALTPDGPTFKAKRVDGKTEMVASTDNWFRPVNFVNAPDGTLHVLDMYRENIEHPWSIPDDIHAAVDLEAGRDLGRLWRLTPLDFKPSKPPRLGSASTAELVATLENPNSWWRETAQRLLFERQDKSAAPALHNLVKKSKSPQTRLHALWTLDGLNELTDDDALTGLKDKAPGVRENALRLAEPRLVLLAGSSRREEALTSPPEKVSLLTSAATSAKTKPSRSQKNPLLDRILQLANESDPRVRLQVAFTLGELSDPRALPALEGMIRRHAEDPWLRTAVLSSVANTGDELLVRLLKGNFNRSKRHEPFLIELAQMIGARGKPEELQRVFAALGGTTPQSKQGERTVLAAIADGLKRSGKSLRRATTEPESRQRINALLMQTEQDAMSETQSPSARAAAIQFLAYDDFQNVRDALALLLNPKQPQEIQRAAIATTGSFTAPDTAPMLLKHWRAQTPALRSEVVLAMLGGRARVLPLLQAIERGEIPANQIPFAKRATLLRSTDAKVKELATKLFSDSAPGSRKEIVAKYQPALSMKGDAARGKKIFEATCATCHRAGDIGKDVGPNLATIRAWNPDQVLINILDPNREVAPNFMSYTVETKDGRTLDGLIAEESAASLTLKRAEGLTDTILRRDIASLTGSGLSLMPEGVEAAVSVEQMADLIAFLLASP